MRGRSFPYLLASVLLERTAFYGFLAVFAAYRVSQGATEDVAAMAVGWVLAKVYGATFIGGVAGQRWGFRWSALAGSLGCCVAYALLAIRAPDWAWQLALLLGIGLYKPSMPIMVARSRPGSRAMSQFYGAVNVGGFVGPAILGLLALDGHYRVAFIVCAGCAAAAGQTLLWGWQHLVPALEDLEEEVALTLAGIGGLQPTVRQLLSRYRWRIAATLLMCLVAVIFWTGYNTFFGKVAAWIEKDVDRSIGGFVVPTAWYSAQNGALILLAGLLAPSWMEQWGMARRLAFAGACSVATFAWMGWSSGQVHPVAWLPAVAVAMETVGELAISPLGLSRVTAMAPRQWVGYFMTGWYLTSALGGWLSGQVTNYWTLAWASAAVVAVAIVGKRVFERAERE